MRQIDADVLDMAIKALKQEPCEDCISRQAALDEKNVVHMELFGKDFPIVPVATLKGLPPVDGCPGGKVQGLPMA